MDSLLADFRFALRNLRRAPWFAGLAVMILTLGIGANSALFSLLDAVLFKGLPYKDPDRLITIEGQQPDRAGIHVPISLFEVVRARAATLEAVSIYDPYGGAMKTESAPVALLGRRVSADFVDLMGVPPLVGRGFLPTEEGAESPAVALITAETWQRYLGGVPEVVGRTIYLDDIPYVIVGVMPPGFRSYIAGNAFQADFWTTRASSEDRVRDLKMGHDVLARMIPGVTIAQVEEELNAIAATVAPKEWAEQGRSLKGQLTKQGIVGDSAYPLQLLLAAVGVVLLIACANLAQLMLARSDRRLNEFATRKAIGAGAGRLFRLSLIESLTLATAGGFCGAALANLLLPFMVRLAPTEIPRISESVIDGRVLLATATFSALTGCLAGLAPAIRLSRLSVADGMKRGSGSATPQKSRFHSSLVVVQIASSIALCVMAALIWRSFLALLPADPGFDAEARTARPFSMQMVPAEERALLLEELLRHLESLPEINAAAYASNIPFGLGRPYGGVRDSAEAEEIEADVRVVTPNYFQLLQIPIVEGRLFEAVEQINGGRGVIVNQTLARKLSSGGKVVGRVIERREREAWVQYRVIGVVADARSSGTTREIWNEMYLPHTLGLETAGYLVFQSSLGAAEIDRLLRDEIYAWDPRVREVPFFKAQRLEDLMSASVAGPRFAATLSGAFSGLALLLAATGVFGLVSYSVSQRLREFGIRAALGAQPRDLLSIALRSAAVSTGTGVAVGLAATIYLVRFVESQLYAVEPLDVPTFAAAGAVMIAVATFSAYLPARHAARIDPAVTLRVE